MGEGTPGAWVRLAADGDQVAWGRLVDWFSPMLWSITRAYRLSTNDSADVVQTTWLRLVERGCQLNVPDSVGSWLATTARRECLGHLARHKRAAGTAEGLLEKIVDQRAAPGEALLSGERDEALWSALGRISERCQQLLRILMNDPPPTYHEVSAALDIPVGSIGPIRGRCLTKLRQHLNEGDRT